MEMTSITTSGKKVRDKSVEDLIRIVMFSPEKKQILVLINYIGTIAENAQKKNTRLNDEAAQFLSKLGSDISSDNHAHVWDTKRLAVDRHVFRKALEQLSSGPKEIENIVDMLMYSGYMYREKLKNSRDLSQRYDTAFKDLKEMVKRVL